MDTLRKIDWLETGLTELSAHGYGALKAQRLAKILKVTRGSFYYHFKNMDAFSAALVGHWSKNTTDALIARIDQKSAPDKALHRLIESAFKSGEKLERAVRSWATVDEFVGKKK